MNISSTPRRLSLPQKIVSKAFQTLWRFTRGHVLRAEALVRDGYGRLLVSQTGALPGARVKEGEAAEDALRRELSSTLGLEEPAVRLIAVAYVPPQSPNAVSTHVALFDVTWDDRRAVPDTHAFAELETLDSLVAPELLTLARRQLK